MICVAGMTSQAADSRWVQERAGQIYKGPTLTKASRDLDPKALPAKELGLHHLNKNENSDSGIKDGGEWPQTLLLPTAGTSAGPEP